MPLPCNRKRPKAPTAGAPRPTRPEAEVEVLVWSDIVRASMQQGILATYLQLLHTAAVYIASGALFRLMRLRKGPMIAALYPIGMLLAAACPCPAGRFRRLPAGDASAPSYQALWPGR